MNNEDSTRIHLPCASRKRTYSSSSMVENHTGRGATSHGGRTGPSMARIAEESPKDFQNLVEVLEKMGGEFFNYVTGPNIKPTFRYLSDVIVCKSQGQLDKCMELLREYGSNRRNGMFGLCQEEDHIHVIHDCSYAGSHCRDSWRQQVQPYGDLRSTRRYNKPIWKFNRTDWYDVFIYFYVQKRGPREIWVRGESGKIPSDDELVRWEEGITAKRSMVRSEHSESDNDSERQQNEGTGRRFTRSFDNNIYEKKASSAGKYANIKLQTKALLSTYYCSPLSAIKDVYQFRSNDLLTNPKHKDYVNASIDDFSKDINEFSLRDIYNMLKCSTPMFFTSMNYDNLDNSIDIVEKLLLFQFDDNTDNIIEFLNTLVDIIDKKLPKTNCLCIISPPSGGKNFFFDMLLAVLLNYGQLGQANKHNVFAFQEAPNKRVLVWNEPNYDSCLTDTIKMMMAGDPYTVRVKHCNDMHVKRTPVFVLTNNCVPFMYDLAFKDRIVKYSWKHASFLKGYEMKPYPMCFFHLLNKYNIQF